MTSPTDYAVNVYGRSGCTKCTATKIMLKKAGLTFGDPVIDDHPDKMAYMEERNMLALPLVEVTGPDGQVEYWNDLDVVKIDELRGKATVTT